MQQKGFMIIGVLIAAMIIGLAFVALLNLSIAGTKTTVAAADYTVAANLAQKQLELLKTKDRTFWATYKAHPDIPWQDAAQANPVTLNHRTYSIHTRSEISHEDEQLAMVTVTVTWRDPAKKDQILQLIMLYDINP